MERRRDRAEHRLSAASTCQHGDHHLRPRRRDHPPGFARQQGADRGRRCAGDERGSGIRHAEYNLEPSKTKIFQIWIEPTTQGGEPTWGSKPFPKGDRSGKLVTIASGFADDADALPIRAKARVLATTLKAGESAEYAPERKRHLYLVPAAGSIEVNGVRVDARDGAAIRDEAKLTITALEDSELVLVDAA